MEVILDILIQYSCLLLVKLCMRKIFTVAIVCLLAWSSIYAVSPRVVKIYDENEIEDLLEAGVSIERRRGDILLCYFPDSDDNEVIITNDVKTDSVSDADTSHTRLHKDPDSKLHKYKGNLYKRKISVPTLDESIRFYDAWKIQDGVGIQSPLTGKGVVVGICDIGLDPLHPTFLDADGRSRIKKVTQYKEYEGIRIELEGDEDYKRWRTDTVDEYHATHVAGILAGNGGGTNYRGIATEADIVVSLSCLTEFGLLMGVEDIIDYAREVGKPAVINLSMGNYIGAHDGTSLFSQYLDLCADEAIIVLSAGNEGNYTDTLSYTFNSNSRPLQFRLGNRAFDQRHMYGITDIWNTSDVPLTITIAIYDDETFSTVYEYESITLTDWESVKYEWDKENPLFNGLSLDGWLSVSGGIDPENGR